MLAVVVSVGAVSSLNSNMAFHVNVREPVPSWITSTEIYCPVPKLLLTVIVLLPANVTLATGLLIAFQVTVEPSVNVSSTVNELPEYVTLPATFKVPATVTPLLDVANLSVPSLYNFAVPW